MSTPFLNQEPGKAKAPDAMRSRLWLAVWQEGAEQGPCANSRLTLQPPCAHMKPVIGGCHPWLTSPGLMLGMTMCSLTSLPPSLSQALCLVTGL